MSFGGYTECKYLLKVKLNEFDPDRRLQSTFCALFIFGTIYIFIPKPLFYSDYFMVLLTKTAET